MNVFPVYTIIEGELVQDGPWPSRCGVSRGDIFLFLSECGPAAVPADIDWKVNVQITEGRNAQVIQMSLGQFLSAEDYTRSCSGPLSMSDADLGGPTETPPPRWLWLYKDRFYVTERDPRSPEFPTVALHIKAAHFKRDKTLIRLREEVANYEAIEINQSGAARRRAIPDDVKMAVWTRDGGTCTKCGAAQDLHFDHIIPHSRGGSDEVLNLQLLCRTCNLAKSDRLA